MNSKWILDRIKNLRTELLGYNYKYYVLDEPVISDREYDRKIRELAYLEENFPKFIDLYSPTRRVGGEVIKNLPTVPHYYKMYSIDNVYRKQELIEWKNSIFKLLKRFPSSYVCELKYDGVSISLIYNRGKFYRAITRGDGIQGNVVTSTIRTIHSIPLAIHGDYPDELEVRGEIILPIKALEKLNKKRMEKGKETFSNTRNTASGIVKLQESKEVAKYPIDCLIYEVKATISQYEALKQARKWGFNVPTMYRFCKCMEKVLGYINFWSKHRYTLPYEIDGVVVKVNSYQEQVILGYTAKFPRWAIAYKFPTERVITELLNVTFQVGSLGKVTPVAHLKPVYLGNTTIKKASLHNNYFINKLNNGDKVWIEKVGEVIPKIVGVYQRDLGSIPIEYLKKCPSCKTFLIRRGGHTSSYCPNDIACNQQIIGRIKHFVSCKAMNIEGIGKETIKFLYQEGLVKNIAELYLLYKKNFLEKSATNMIESMENSKKVSFERVLYALSIRYIGEFAVRKLVLHYGGFEAMIKASFKDIIADLIGIKISDSLKNYFSDDRNLTTIRILEQVGSNFINGKNTKNNLGVFTGKTFLFTGKLSEVTRKQAERFVLKQGGLILRSVSKNLNYLIVGNKPGTKLIKSLAIKKAEVWTEEKFLSLSTE